MDGANVVGSVPDGWWHDCAGAAARLHAALASTQLPFDVVVLVLEGKARAGVWAGTLDGVTTVHAPASGDNEIVARCRDARTLTAARATSEERLRTGAAAHRPRLRTGSEAYLTRGPGRCGAFSATPAA